MDRYPYISVEGNIGSGKTTLVNAVAHSTGRIPLLERFENNTHLPLFYTDTKEFALLTETHFLKDRIDQLQVVKKSEQGIISDYCIDKCKIFARQNLSETEWLRYQAEFNTLTRLIPRPDLLIFIPQPVTCLMENIARRGREMEKTIKEEYLEALNKAYRQWLQEISSLIPVIELYGIDNEAGRGTPIEKSDKITGVLNTDWKPGIHVINL